MGEPVLVTGGSGFVGGAVLSRLLEQGRDVRALARSERARDEVERLGATPVRGDLLDIASLEAAMRDCSIVFHAAGVNEMCRRDPRPMFEANVEGSGNVVRAAARAEVGRVVYTSSAATIGEARDTVGDEGSAHRGSFLSRYERSKYLAERRVRSLAEELGVDVVCVNPSSVQGPGRTSGSARLLLDLVNGKLPALVETTLSIVDVEDCTRGHLLAETLGRPGERYVVNGATLPVRDAVDALERVLERRIRVRYVPGWVAWAGAAMLEVLGWIARRDPPVCREAVRTLLHGHRYDGSKAARELGLEYTPLEETLRRTLFWYADRGLGPPPAGRPPSPAP